MTQLHHPLAGDRLPPSEIHITQALIDTYAQLSGDFNPIHVSAPAGEEAGFGGTIAHGCLPLEPVLQSLQRWSGRHSLPQGTRIQLRYRAPSRPGDTICSSISIRDVQASSVTLIFTCNNQHGQPVLDGECMWPGEAL